MRPIIAATVTAIVLAVAACGGGDSDNVTDDPEVKQTIEQLEANGAPQSQIDEVIDYAGELEGDERSSYLELVQSMNEASEASEELGDEIREGNERGDYDFNPDDYDD